MARNRVIVIAMAVGLKEEDDGMGKKSNRDGNEEGKDNEEGDGERR